MKKCLMLCLSIVMVLLSKSQQLQRINQTLEDIYRKYDSTKNLSFDVRFEYSSDTLLGKYDYEQMAGKYILAGNKARYTLGDIDFLQNDSFFIAVYNRDKLIIVDEPKLLNSGSILPMRQQLDSLLQNYNEHYNINSYNLSEDTGVIELIKSDSTAQLDRFSITYNRSNKMMLKLYYEYKEAADLDTNAIAVLKSIPGAEDKIPIQKKRLTIHFLNYRNNNFDDVIFNENNYIWFDNGMWKPTTMYNDYKIYYTKQQKVYRDEIEQQ